MVPTSDTHLMQIKEKLENVAVNLEKAKTSGTDLMKLHQTVLKSLVIADEDKDLMKVYTDSTNDQIKKTEKQLKSIEARLAASANVLKAIEDKDNLRLILDVLVFIGVENADEEVNNA